MSRISKKKFLFNWHFPLYNLYKRKFSNRIKIDDIDFQKVSADLYEELISPESTIGGGMPRVIMNSLNRMGLREDKYIDGAKIDSVDTILIWLKSANEYRERIDTLSDDEIDQEFEIVRAKIHIEQAMEDEEEFFNHHDADADFDHWLTMACWNAQEAVALSMGKDPRVVNRETLDKELEERMTDNAFVSESVFFREYLKRCEQVARAQEIDFLPKNITPSAFVEWAVGQKIKLDEKFAKTLNGIAQPTPLSSQNEKLHGKTRVVFLKMLFGLAISHYEKDPDAYVEDHIVVAKRISADLKLTGVVVDEKTITNYLREASQSLLDQGLKLKVPPASNGSHKTQ